jgi:hypothetical protein
MNSGGEVHDSGHTSERGTHGCAIEQVADNCDLATWRRNGISSSRQNNDFVSVGSKRSAEMRADEPCRAGYENALRQTSRSSTSQTRPTAPCFPPVE